MAINSKGKGKPGGAKIITFLKVENKNIFPVDIYDKSEQATISEKQLDSIIQQLTGK